MSLKNTKETSAVVLGAGNRTSMAEDEEFTTETVEALPAQLLIKIKSFSSLWEQGIQKYKSREFEAGEYKWRLIIHPDGLIKSENKDNYISVYVAIVKSSSMSSDWEVNAYFRIFLYNQILDNYLCFQGKRKRYHPMKTRWGFSKLISKKSFRDPSNGFLVNDNCVFGAEVDVIKTKRVIECVSFLKVSIPYKRDWKISNFSKLGEVWKSEEFTCGGQNWMVKVYPNGLNIGKGKSVSMYLDSVDSKSFASDKKVKVDFCLRIKNQLNNNHCLKKLTHLFTLSEGDWGWTEFIPIVDMLDPKKGFIVNDCCFVDVEISV